MLFMEVEGEEALEGGSGGGVSSVLNKFNDRSL